MKTQFTTESHDVIEIQLVDYDLKGETNDYLPLNSENQWEYEWTHREGAIDNEVCIVTFADDKTTPLTPLDNPLAPFIKGDSLNSM